ncbi:hypothetical protein G9A89_021942 [Geosiphon pyriformis]|nr:hypothetical protein G9A89_021942 [Geosiphon pyriformis]
MTHDLGNLLAGADTGNRVCCAVVCFENNKELESAFHTKPIFGGVRLSWARLDMVQYEQCGELDHSVLECNAGTSTSLTLSKSFKRVVSNENCLQLAKLYVKKGVPISRLAAFGSKLWAQVVSLVSSSNGPHFGSGPGFSSFSGASGVVGYLSPASPHFLELFTDKVSGIIDKLDSLNLVPLALAFSSQPLVVPGLVNVEFDLDMVLDEPKSVVPPPSSVSSGASSLGSSSSKILTSKMGCLELKLMALEASVCSVLEKLDQMCAGLDSAVSSNIATCNVRRMNNSAKQEDIICWHRDMNNLVSIVIETKLKNKVRPWIANKFNGVWVFISGLDSGYFGSGVVIIINNVLVKHVCKVFEVPGRLLSVKLLFKNKLLMLILGLYAGASVSAHFSQADKINFLIAKAVNESSFVILDGNFNEDGSYRCASFKKCFDLGLVNVLGGSLFGKNATWTKSRGVTKTIDYVFVSSSLVNAILDHSVTGVNEYFDTDHRAVTVSMDLSSLLDKFNFKDAMTAKWAAFKESSAATVAMFKCKFDAALLFLDLDAIYDNVFTKEFSKFHKLELLVFKLVKASHLISSEEFVALLGMWNSLDATNASVVESLFLSGLHFGVIRSVLFRIKKLYHSSKLSKSKHAEESLGGLVLNHLVVNNELVMNPSLVKSKMNVIMEGWTRKHELVTNISANWCHQYQSLEYIFDDAFLRIMDSISSVELLGVVLDLPNDKAAGLFGISNELWKHRDESVLNMLLVFLNSCLLCESVLGPWKKAWVSMIPKPYEWKRILSKILLDRISLACSTYNVLHRDNFLSPIFAVGSVVEDALEKNRELWLVLQNMKKTYNSSLIRIKMCGRFIQFFGNIHNNQVNRVMTDFGLTDDYQVQNDFDQGEVFSSLLWHIFYDSLLCEVKRQEEFCGYRLNSHFIARTGRVEPWAGFSSFFAAGAFVDNTIWVSGSQTAIQHILNVASEFFRINDISINNDKTVAIPINCRVVNPFLTISGAPISIAKKGELH